MNALIVNGERKIRKLALDQRLINDMLPDNETSKAATCVGRAFEIWEQTMQKMGV